MKKALLMDFDGTFADTNSIKQLVLIKFYYLNFANFLVWFIAFMIYYLPKLLWLYQKDSILFNRILFMQYKDYSVQELESILQGPLCRHLLKQIYYQAVETLLSYQKRGYAIFILSANQIPLLEAVFKEFKGVTCIGNQLEVQAGCYTGRLIEPILDGPEKAERIKILCQGYDHTVYFGNSRYDIPACEMCDEGYLINYRKKAPGSIQQLRWQGYFSS